MYIARYMLTAVATVLMISVALPALPAEPKAPIRLQPPGHTFTVSMPSQPQHDRRSTRTAVGAVYTDVWNSRDGDNEFTVSITDLPSVALWFNSAESLFEQARDKMLETLGAQQAGRRSLDRGNFTEQLDYFVPGRAGVKARRGRAWFALADDKLVVLTAMVPLNNAARLDQYFSQVEPDTATVARR